MTRLLLSCTLMVIAAAGIAHAGWWMRPQDTRPIDELDLMNDSELLNEAESACSMGSIYVGPVSRYLETIRLVARKHGKGKEPPWATEMRAAFETGQSEPCRTVGKKYGATAIN